MTNFWKKSLFPFLSKMTFWHFWKRNVYFSALNVQISHFLGGSSSYSTSGVFGGGHFWGQVLNRFLIQLFLHFWSTSNFSWTLILYVFGFQRPIFWHHFLSDFSLKNEPFFDPPGKIQIFDFSWIRFLGPQISHFFSFFREHVFYQNSTISLIKLTSSFWQKVIILGLKNSLFRFFHLRVLWVLTDKSTLKSGYPLFDETHQKVGFFNFVFIFEPLVAGKDFCSKRAHFWTPFWPPFWI